MNNKNLIKGLVFGLTFVVLLTVLVFSQEKKIYHVVVDGQERVVEAYFWQSDETIIENAGIKLNNKDSYVLATDNKIEVVRAVPIVVFYQGQTKELWTSQLTVEKALVEAGIELDNYKVIPDRYVRPSKDMGVFVLQENESIVQNFEEIPYETVTKNDSHMELGEQRVMHEGNTGNKSVFFKVATSSTGELIKTQLTEIILQKPQEKIVAMGTVDTIQTSRGDLRFTEVRQMEATAYTPWDEGCIGITANGMKAGHGVVAVDPRVIPLGTRLYIQGYGYAIAADTGGAIKGNRIDLCMETKNEAFSFGRRPVKVYILE